MFPLLRRPTQCRDPNCAFIFTGAGVAVIPRQLILEFLYNSALSTPHRDFIALAHSSFAICLATGCWTQVDTPSVEAVVTPPFSDDDQ